MPEQVLEQVVEEIPMLKQVLAKVPDQSGAGSGGRFHRKGSEDGPGGRFQRKAGGGDAVEAGLE